MIRSMLACTGVLVVTLLSAATNKPQVYRNAEFGIALPVPVGVMLCPTLKDEHDHGPLMLLDRFQAKRCTDAEWGRFISVFAMYNAADITKTLNSFLQSECADPDTGKGECGPAPPHLQIGGMRSAAGTVNHSNGWMDIIVVTQAGKPNPGFDASVPSVNYVMRLRTRQEHQEADLRTFRTVLQTIQLSPPE
jgi:hypothetical protein